MKPIIRALAFVDRSSPASQRQRMGGGIIRRRLMAARPLRPMRGGEARASGFLSWGLEDWGCDTSSYTIQIGNGADVNLIGIQGFVSVAINPLAAVNTTYIRQSLVAVTYNGAASHVNGRVVSNPTQPRFQHEVDANLMAVNIKQSIRNDALIPVNITYPAPVVIPQGILTAVIDTRYYDGNYELVSPPGECLDIELHLILSYQ